MNIVKRTGEIVLRPVDLDTAKAHLKVSGSLEDNLILLYLDAAIRACENNLQRSIMSAEHELHAKNWQVRYSLQQYPVTDIESVKYYDADGVLQSVASGMYRVQSFRSPAVLEMDDDFNEPSLHERQYPVVITFQAGYTAATGTNSVSAIIRDAVLMELTDRYENRQNEVAGTSIAMFSNNASAWLAQESLWL